MKPFYKVCAVILTYGERKYLLEQVIDSLMRQTYPLNKIIIVDNAADKKTGEFLSNLARFNSKISIIYLNENTGSAKGYKIGIKEACKIACDYVWLLDDDNMPEDNALEELICAWDALHVNSLNTITALLSLRLDRKQYVKVAEGGSVKKYFGKQNSFLGFHLVDIPSKLINKIAVSFQKSNVKQVQLANINLKNVDVPYAPYGGLFLHKNIIDYIGYPDENFYLYSDDHDFTYRITQLGGRIALIPSSKIIDIDKSWHIERGNKLSFIPQFIKKINENNMFRIYYSIRNRIYFEKNNVVNNLFIYYLNTFIYSFWVSLVSIFGVIISPKNQFAKILLVYYISVKDGLFGKLGKRNDWGFNYKN
ncbi:glycosyltransferase [Desulfoscipio geothermicus]|uniref:Glycosyltransferase, GT2 family n=1 Tax=Desulfoscipio geothermicus DSM 3669 TaxID=1121426 RepID=A0A1I6E929_9FIRM|nr:glycosyltransferase [Desulfoscipio geothermicus]SFR14229.1 Glycosyltransferase, GT2 family [Desulfoscipio geothermicus DSM 3669]